MSPLQSRAWLQLWGMCPPYLVYFALQVGAPGLVGGFVRRFAWLAAAACAHAAVCLIGVLVLKRRERGETLLADERDRAIDARATRIAYFVLLSGTIIVGMMMPFNRGGWDLVNAALLAIVLAEIVRSGLIVAGYRGSLRLAH